MLQLITVHAEPVIKGVIRFKLRLTATQRAEAENIYQEVVLQLLAQLQKFRQLPEAHYVGPHWEPGALNEIREVPYTAEYYFYRAE